MKLHEGTWKADFKDLILRFFDLSSDRFGSLFSFESGAAYYNPYAFYINSARSGLWTTGESVKIDIDSFMGYLRSGLPGKSSDSARLAFLLKETVWLHEMRHFHDCVCTRSGIHDFLITQGYLARILIELLGLRAEGKVLRKPLVNSVAEGEIKGTPASNLLDLFGSLCAYKAVFNGDIPAIDVPTEFLDAEVVWLDFENAPQGLRIPTFPAGMKVDGETRCSLVPLGFRALTEAGATIYQRMALRDIDQRFVQQYSAILRTQPVYVVINLFLTRIARGRGLREALERAGGEDLIYELVDRTLHNAAGFGLAHGEDHPAAEMVRRIEGSLDLEGGSFQETTALGDPEIGMRLDDPELQGSPNFFDIIRSYALQHCWRTSCEVYRDAFDRLASIREQCHRPVWYLGLATMLPSAPLSIQDGVIHHNGDERLRQEFLPALMRWLFFLEVVEQIPTQQVLRCPIAHERYGGIGRLEPLRPHPECSNARPDGACGRAVLGESMTGHVDCLWKSCLRGWALVKY